MPLAIGIGVSPVFGGSAGISYEAETNALVARFTTPPTTQRKGLINDLIKSLKTAGVWSKLDALYLTAAADNQAARRNWIADQYNLTAVSAPTFTADRGYAGDGAASYLSLGINLSLGGLKATINANGAGVWLNTSTAQTLTDMGGPDFSFGANQSPGNASYRNSSNAAQTVAAPDATDVGLWQSSRQAAGSYAMMKNGVTLSSPATASTSFVSPAMFLGCRSDGAGSPVVFSTRRIAASYFGNLTVADSIALYTALNTYLTAVGGN